MKDTGADWKNRFLEEGLDGFDDHQILELLLNKCSEKAIEGRGEIIENLGMHFCET